MSRELSSLQALVIIIYSSQGYLYSSTVDFLAEDPMSLSYTWVLMLSGFIIPNIFIISSHIFVCNIYR